MNPLTDSDQGAILTAKEFEEAAIAAHLVEDLMDRTDLEPGEFLDNALVRVNASRTAQNNLLWVASPSRATVFLVRASLVPGINRASALARAMSAQVVILQASIQEITDAGCKP